MTRAACARPVEALPRRREEDESVAVLLEGAHEQAVYSASFAPHAAGLAMSAVGLLAASLVVLGPLLTLCGGALLGGLGMVTLLLGRGLARSQTEVWDGFGRLSREMRLLLEGGTELRAAGREADVAERVLSIARHVAAHQARASAAGARLAVLPASLALVSVAAPLRAGVGRVEALLAGPRLFEASILGAAALATGFAGARLWEQWSSTAPRRARFREFVGGTRQPAAPALVAPPSGHLADLPIVFRGFGRDWSGDGRLTPSHLDLELPGRRGIALVGPNGSGKTTAALALLGVVAPTVGTVTIGDVETSAIDRRAMGHRIGYVPQDPVLVPGASIGWHCGLHDGAPPTEAAIDAALERVGLQGALASRARARGVEVRALPAGELSGGERRRFALARALLHPRELYVLDEPEAGLDSEARAALSATLEELAKTARVVLIAHDASIIPPGFLLVRLPGPALTS